MSDTGDTPQVRGTTPGNVGTVPLLTLLDEYKNTNDTRWRGMLDEERTFREGIRQDIKAWREAHERVHKIENTTMETKTLVMDKRLDQLNGERAQINSEREGLATKDTLQGHVNTLMALIASLEKSEGTRINALEKQIATFNGQLKLLGVTLTIAMFVISVAVKFIGN